MLQLERTVEHLVNLMRDNYKPPDPRSMTNLAIRAADNHAYTKSWQ